MDKHFKKTLIYILLTLLVFIAGVLGIDKANQNLQHDIDKSVETIRQSTQSANTK